MSKILLVEDTQSIILGLEYLFKEEGFELNVATNKKQAIQKIDTEKFDLILLDIMLPDGNGFEIGKYIKKNTNTPIIFLTAKDEEKDVVYGLELGAEDYIVKPFECLELLARIEVVLRRVNKTKQIYCFEHIELRYTIKTNFNYFCLLLKTQLFEDVKTLNI